MSDSLMQFHVTHSNFLPVDEDSVEFLLSENFVDHHGLIEHLGMKSKHRASPLSTHFLVH